MVTGHSQTLSGLQPSTTYHFRVASTDSTGNVVRSADGVFTTAGGPTFRLSSTVIAGTTVSAPAGTAAGHVMIASLEVDAYPVTVAGPAGWVQALDPRVGNGLGGFVHAQIWDKVATASEPATYSRSVPRSLWVHIGVLDYANVNSSRSTPLPAAMPARPGTRSSAPSQLRGPTG